MVLHIQTAVVNNPTFIELQHQTLRYYASGDYTFTVFNNAKQFADYSNFGDTTIYRQIQRTCERLNIPCIHVPSDHHQWDICAANRCADAMAAILDYQRRQKGRHLCLDSDMFPVCQLNVEELYATVDAAVVPQERTNEAGKCVNYFWNGLYAFNMDTLSHTDLLSWRNNDVEGVWTDVGGAMFGFLKASTQSRKNRIFAIPYKRSLQWGFEDFPYDRLDSSWLSFLMTDSRNEQGKFFGELYDDTFLHFRAGGNWMRGSPDAYARGVQSLKDTVFSVCRD